MCDGVVSLQGKSTLVLALFRLISQRGGVVRIDGLDISTITLRALRSALSVIPQDPLLFHASIRTNLDPYLSASSERLWHVLELVQLKDTVQALPGGLEFVVSDAGENFSLGQRQLSTKPQKHIMLEPSDVHSGRRVLHSPR